MCLYLFILELIFRSKSSWTLHLFRVIFKKKIIIVTRGLLWTDTSGLVYRWVYIFRLYFYPIVFVILCGVSKYESTKSIFRWEKMCSSYLTFYMSYTLCTNYMSFFSFCRSFVFVHRKNHQFNHVLLILYFIKNVRQTTKPASDCNNSL